MPSKPVFFFCLSVEMVVRSLLTRRLLSLFGLTWEASLNVCILFIVLWVIPWKWCPSEHRLNYRLSAVGVSLWAVLAGWGVLSDSKVVYVLAVLSGMGVKACLHKCHWIDCSPSISTFSQTAQGSRIIIASSCASYWKDVGGGDLCASPKFWFSRALRTLSTLDSSTWWEPLCVKGLCVLTGIWFPFSFSSRKYKEFWIFLV